MNESAEHSPLHSEGATVSAQDGPVAGSRPLVKDEQAGPEQDRTPSQWNGVFSRTHIS